MTGSPEDTIREARDEDYATRTIETIRQHNPEHLRQNWWTGAALALADETEALRGERERLEQQRDEARDDNTRLLAMLTDAERERDEAQADLADWPVVKDLVEERERLATALEHLAASPDRNTARIARAALAAGDQDAPQKDE